MPPRSSRMPDKITWQSAWHRVFRARDFYSSIRLLIGLALLLGITPYHITRDYGGNGERVVRESWWGFANAISRWLMCAYCYWHVNLHSESLIGYFMHNHISAMSTRIHDVGGILAAVVIFIAPLYQRRHLRRSIEILVRIDRRLADLRSPVSYASVQLETVKTLFKILALDGTIITVCLVCFAKLQITASWQLYFLMIYELITITITIFMFCLLALSVRRRLMRLHTVSWGGMYSKIFGKKQN